MARVGRVLRVNPLAIGEDDQVLTIRYTPVVQDRISRQVADIVIVLEKVGGVGSELTLNESRFAIQDASTDSINTFVPFVVWFVVHNEGGSGVTIEVLEQELSEDLPGITLVVIRFDYTRVLVTPFGNLSFELSKSRDSLDQFSKVRDVEEVVVLK